MNPDDKFSIHAPMPGIPSNAHANNDAFSHLDHLLRRWMLVDHSLSILQWFCDRQIIIGDELSPTLWIIYEGAWVSIVSQVGCVFIDNATVSRHKTWSIKALCERPEFAGMQVEIDKINQNHNEIIKLIKQARDQRYCHADAQVASNKVMLDERDLSKLRDLSVEIVNVLENSGKKLRILVSFNSIDFESVCIEMDRVRESIGGMS